MALIIEIKVVPSSGRSSFQLDKSGILKAYLKNPAQRGLANQELIKTMAKALKLTQKEVVIISGETARNKRIKINSDITLDDVLQSLGIEQQLMLFKK